jgi:SAM-dependent methyltransferase
MKLSPHADRLEPSPDREEGSFRDRNGQIFYHGGEVFRGISEKALCHWRSLSATDFFAAGCASGRLTPTEEIDPVRKGLPLQQTARWAAVLRHDPIPFVSYPYEWPFSALRDAALLQLRLLSEALSENMILKDASSFNIQWQGIRPIFIDIPSFETWVPGEPWAGYRQFCQLFLYPLMLQAYKNVPFHHWLRGHIDGIEPEVMAGLISWRDLLRPGVLLHVSLHARLQRFFEKSTGSVKSELQDSGFARELILNNVSRLKKLVERLCWKQTRSVWTSYDSEHRYAEEDRLTKESFVRRAAATRHWPLAWDLGCNVGTYSRILADHADYVVAMDADHPAVDQLYRCLRQEQTENILPLVINLADPSPSLGWAGRERKDLPARGTPHLILCLALLHHMVIQANIPLDSFISWLRSLGSALVIEFVCREDPMVQRLLRNKTDEYADYDLEYFERVLQRHFRIISREKLPCSTRILFFADPA